MRDKFVNISDYIDNIILEIRYYSTYNFVGKRIDGYKYPVALLTKEAAESIKIVNEKLNKKGYCLKVYDAYRPSKSVDHFVRWAKDIDDIKMKDIFYPNVDKSKLFELGYIAKRSSHSRGSSVDVTLVDMKSGKELDMGSPFDYFSEMSHPSCKNISVEQYNNRKMLNYFMTSNGFIALDTEWWHYTLADEPYPDTYFDFDVE